MACYRKATERINEWGGCLPSPSPLSVNKRCRCMLFYLGLSVKIGLKLFFLEVFFVLSYELSTPLEEFAILTTSMPVIVGLPHILTAFELDILFPFASKQLTL